VRVTTGRHGRVTALAALATAALLGAGGLPGVAHAQVTCPPTAPQCESTTPGTPPTPGTPGTPGGGGGPSGDPNAPIWRYFLGSANALSQQLLPPGTTQCYNTGLGGNMTAAEAQAAAFSQPDAPGCPDLSGLPGANGLTELVKARIPAPAPQIRPGKNVTGLKAYLETGLEPFTQDEAVGPITVTFALRPAEVSVDWGDGSPKGTYDRPGVPYQERDGRKEITHTYERSGDEPCERAEDGASCYVVTVDAEWAWTATVNGGPQDGVQFDGTYIDPRQGDLTLPVEQVQAVRNR